MFVFEAASWASVAAALPDSFGRWCCFVSVTAILIEIEIVIVVALASCCLLRMGFLKMTRVHWWAIEEDSFGWESGHCSCWPCSCSCSSWRPEATFGAVRAVIDMKTYWILDSAHH